MCVREHIGFKSSIDLVLLTLIQLSNSLGHTCWSGRQGFPGCRSQPGTAQTLQLTQGLDLGTDTFPAALLPLRGENSQQQAVSEQGGKSALNANP